MAKVQIRSVCSTSSEYYVKRAGTLRVALQRQGSGFAARIWARFLTIGVAVADRDGGGEAGPSSSPAPEEADATELARQRQTEAELREAALSALKQRLAPVQPEAPANGAGAAAGGDSAAGMEAKLLANVSEGQPDVQAAGASEDFSSHVEKAGPGPVEDEVEDKQEMEGLQARSVNARETRRDENVAAEETIDDGSLEHERKRKRHKKEKHKKHKKEKRSRPERTEASEQGDDGSE